MHHVCERFLVCMMAKSKAFSNGLYTPLSILRRESIKAWEELKREMKERFFPLYYKRYLFVMLQNIYQDTRSVEKYFKEMEVTIVKAQIIESQEAIMTRFLHGLNRDIQDIVELHDYTYISTFVNQATKVESQLRRHGRKSYLTTCSNWKGKEKREEKLLRKDRSPKKGNVPFKGHREEVSKNVPNSNTHKSSNCLGKGHIASQCRNKRKMILKDDGDINSESSQEEVSTSGNEGYSSEEVPYEGDLLMVRRLINTFIKDDQSQRENIFHLRCMVNGNFCSLIISGYSSVNVTSPRLVDKLCLPTIPHPKPYKLQWLSEK
ncbi:hypothetical protein CR513_13432, partial [Mucuna pruriens]